MATIYSISIETCLDYLKNTRKRSSTWKKGMENSKNLSNTQYGNLVRTQFHGFSPKQFFCYKNGTVYLVKTKKTRNKTSTSVLHKTSRRVFRHVGKMGKLRPYNASKSLGFDILLASRGPNYKAKVTTQSSFKFCVYFHINVTTKILML